ncbi:hypothetical protein BOX15_Mlig021667g1, partial [Macrostomum lignano]
QLIGALKMGEAIPLIQYEPIQLNEAPTEIFANFLYDSISSSYRESTINTIQEHLTQHMITVGSIDHPVLQPLYEIAISNSDEQPHLQPSSIVLKLASSLMLTIPEILPDIPNQVLVNREGILLPDAQYAQMASRYRLASYNSAATTAEFREGIFALLNTRSPDTERLLRLTLADAKRLGKRGRYFQTVQDFLRDCRKWNNPALFVEGFQQLLLAAMVISPIECRDPNVVKVALKRLANAEMGFVILAACRCQFKILGFYLLRALSKLELPARPPCCRLTLRQHRLLNLPLLVPRLPVLIVDPQPGGRPSQRCQELITMSGATSLKTLCYRNFFIAPCRNFNGFSDEEVLQAQQSLLRSESIGAVVCLVSSEADADDEFYSSSIRLVTDAARHRPDLLILWCLEQPECVEQLRQLGPDVDGQNGVFVFQPLIGCVGNWRSRRTWPVWRNLLNALDGLSYL